MNRTAFVFAAFGLTGFLARDAAAAHQVTLNIVQSQSTLALSGDFSMLPFLPQDVPAPGAPVPGTTDANPALPSTTTTFQGTITVKVDNAMSPSAIQILSSNADADVSGSWLPEVEPYLDLDMDGVFGELEEDSLPTQGDNPAPATDGDWGFRLFHPAFQANIAYASARDISYNITSPVEAVVGGQFNSTTENFEFATGWLDYWIAPAAGNIRGRAELAGGDDDNASLLPSLYTVTPLPFNKKQITLTIPIDINDPDEDVSFFYDGQLVATLIVPEPTSLTMIGLGLLGFVIGRRNRR
jgi:hypothetical protein